MFKTILITENVDSLKRQLRSFYPALKSSHLSEAIARALGYKSYAALKIALQENKKPKLSIASFNNDVFIQWLNAINYQSIKPVSHTVFQNIPVPMWQAIRPLRKKDTSHPSNDWFRVCKKHNIPCVYIEQKTKYTSVNWDYISVDESHDPSKFTNKEILSLVKTYGNPKTKYEFGVFTGNIERLEKNKAEIIASNIFCILHSLIDEKKCSG